jgi:ribosome-associated translation inhibitor RaiA
MRIRFLDVTDDEEVDRRARVERRLRLVVGRRAPRISLVEVSLSFVPADGAAPGDGAHRCRIRARLVGGEEVVVDEQARDLEAAVEVASWRLDRRLSRPASRASARA